MRVVLTLLAMASFCTAARAQAPEPKFKGKSLAEWVERLQKAGSDADQLTAANAIKSFGPDAAPALPALIEMLDDHSPEYRILVQKILISLGQTANETVPALIKRFKEMPKQKPGTVDDAWEIRCQEMIEIFAKIGPSAKAAVPVLITMLDNPVLSNSAIKALCSMGPEAKAAIPVISRVVMEMCKDLEQKQQPPYVGLNVFNPFELCQLGPDVLPLLLELLEHAGTVGKGLALLQLRGELGPLARQALPQVAPLLEDKNARIRFLSAELLWELNKNKSVMPALVALLRGDDQYLVGCAAYLLGEMGSTAKEALPLLNVTLSEQSAYYHWISLQQCWIVPISYYQTEQNCQALTDAIWKIKGKR